MYVFFISLLFIYLFVCSFVNLFRFCTRTSLESACVEMSSGPLLQAVMMNCWLPIEMVLGARVKSRSSLGVCALGEEYQMAPWDIDRCIHRTGEINNSVHHELLKLSAFRADTPVFLSAEIKYYTNESLGTSCKPMVDLHIHRVC